MLSKVEIDILTHLNENGLIDPMNSRTIKNISKDVGINYFRTRNQISHLCLLQLIALGYKEKNSNTYYLTEKGKKIIGE